MRGRRRRGREARTPPRSPARIPPRGRPPRARLQDLSSTLPLDEFERLAREWRPPLARGGVQHKPLAHRSALAGVEVPAFTRAHKLVDAGPRQLEHELVAHQHGEDATLHLQLAARAESLAPGDLAAPSPGRQRPHEGGVVGPRAHPASIIRPYRLTEAF